MNAGDLWVPLIFVLFNAGDVLGRALAGFGSWAARSPPVPTLLAYGAARILLAAAFLWCHVVTASPWALPTIFRCPYHTCAAHHGTVQHKRVAFGIPVSFTNQAGNISSV